MWILPVAPLSDWPAHLAIARESFLLSTGAAQNAYYYVDFSFLGYSLVHLFMMFLQYFTSWQTAGQITLTLLFLITPFCWWAFFRILDKSKEWWLVFGFLINYSIFFYYGMINYVFAIHVGLVWIAIGIDAVLRGKRRLVPFLVLGAITFLLHAYVLILLSIALLAVFFYEWAYRGHKSEMLTALATVAILSVAVISAIFNPTTVRDQSYFNGVRACALALFEKNSPSIYDPKTFIGEIVVSVNNFATQENPLYFLSPVGLFPTIIFFIILISIGFALVSFVNFVQTGRPISKLLGNFSQLIVNIKFEPIFLAIALIFLIHFIILPSCPARICSMREKSLPLFFAFLLLSIKIPANIIKPAAIAISIIILFSIAMQELSFNQYAYVQKGILERLQASAGLLPDGATVFAIPAEWNTFDKTDFLYPPYRNPHYQELLPIYKPTAYVSGLFLYQETFILRTKFPIFDSMVEFGPDSLNMKTNVSSCYSSPPKQFDYILDENIGIKENPYGRG